MRILKIASLFFLLLLITSCEKDKKIKKIATDEATKLMIKELYDIAMDKSNINVWHLNKERAIAIDDKINSIPNNTQKINFLFKAGIEWLNAGDFNKAIERLNSISTLIQNNQIQLPPDLIYTLQELKGIVYLRKAEIENCIQNHNEYSCLLPIDKKGQHIYREGGEKALEIFRELLKSPKATTQTKWLYNITHMTLGGYPDKVEKEFLIDQSIFRSNVDFPRFKEVAMSLGVGVNDISGSVIMEDFNNDGYLDLMVSSYGLNDQLHYFQNNRKNGFDDLTESAGLNGLWSGLNMVQADYNNDGWIDVLVLRGAWLGKDGNHPNSLLKNNGDGTFSDVTKESGLYCHYPTQTASWADFNNDGWIDLFIGNEHSSNISAPAQLFHNNGDGTFRNVAEEKGVAIKGFIKGSIWGDYNNDGNPDLYLSLINEKNYLLENGGKSNNYKFINKAEEAQITEPITSFPCWFFDYNQDGWEDIFVSGFDFRQFDSAAGEVAKDYLKLPFTAQLPKLYRNDQNGSFTEVSEELAVNKVLYTMGCNFGDLNNDGYPDFYAATGTPDFRSLIPNRMFLNGEGKQFFDVTTAGGFGHLQKGHGVAFGDIDNDGDQDVYNVLGGSYDGDNFMNALFLNPGNANNWIKIKLQGTTANRAGIGARVKIYASNSEGKMKTFFNTMNSGASFGANPLLIEQGLGTFNIITKIEILWPGRNVPQIVSNVKLQSYIIITQDEPTLKYIPFEEVKYSLDHDHHHRH